jgi:membrane fusion protein, multidrug efflux system
METTNTAQPKSSNRAAALLWLAGLVAAGCGGRAEAVPSAGAPQPPKVTVAQPIVASVAEFSEHTGRTEAPNSVEIRARASGYLVRADFREGDLVKKGDLLFVVDPRPYQAALARARAELQSAVADHELAKKNTKRDEQLYKENVINEREWDIQSAAQAQMAARRSAAAAAVQSAELDLAYTQIRSPIDGRIGRVLVTVGNLVGPGTATPLAAVVSVDPLFIYVDVDEVQGLRLRRNGGGAARVGFPGEDGYPHEAPITFLDNRVDPATGTLRVRAVLKNPDGSLSDGLFARVQITYGTVQQAVLVSDRAIGTDQDKRFVWVVGEDGKAKYRGVKLGALEGGLRVVRDGLAATDRVVVRGLQRIRPGVEVAPETIQMSAVDQEEAAQ